MSVATRLGPFLTALALCIVLGANLSQARQAHASLGTVVANQKTAISGSARAETQLDALAKGTQLLARQGNANAAKIVAILQSNGVQINGG
jgi:hypothetical protein